MATLPSAGGSSHPTAMAIQLGRLVAAMAIQLGRPVAAMAIQLGRPVAAMAIQLGRPVAAVLGGPGVRYRSDTGIRVRRRKLPTGLIR